METDEIKRSFSLKSVFIILETSRDSVVWDSVLFVQLSLITKNYKLLTKVAKNGNEFMLAVVQEEEVYIIPKII